MEIRRITEPEVSRKNLSPTILSNLISIQRTKKDFRSSPNDDYLRKTFNALYLFAHENKSIVKKIKERFGLPKMSPKEEEAFIACWDTFANNENIQKTIGEDQMRSAEEKLEAIVLKKLFSPAAASTSNDMLNKMHTPKLAPYQLLKKFRYNAEINKDDINEFLSGYSQANIKRLGVSPIPGVTPLFFASATGIKTDMFQDFSKIIFYLIENGSTEERIWISNRLPKFIASKENAQTITGLLMNSDIPIDVKKNIFPKSRNANVRMVFNIFMNYLANNNDAELERFMKSNLGNEDLFFALKEIYRYFPDFIYPEFKYDLGHDRAESQYWRIDVSSFKSFMKIKAEMSEIPDRFMKSVISQVKSLPNIFDVPVPSSSLRESSYTSKRSLSNSAKTTDIEFKDAFNQAIDSASKNPQTIDRFEWYFKEFLLPLIYLNPDQAGKIAALPQNHPQFFKLMDEGGTLRTTRINIIKSLLTGDIEKNVQMITRMFTTREPYWKQLYFFTENLLGDELINATSNYPVISILGKPIDEFILQHKHRIKNFIKDERSISFLPDGRRYIPFSRLADLGKRLVFRDYLRRVVETSRRESAKKQAEEKNRLFSRQNFNLLEGDYIQGMSYVRLDSVLLNGSLCGEAVGQRSAMDRLPFHSDWGVVQSDLNSMTDAVRYSRVPQFAGNAGIILILKRNMSNYEKGIEYSGFYQTASRKIEAQILAGVPATEISGIAVLDPAKTYILEDIKRKIIENCMFIPLYDMNGRIIFTEEEYDAIVKDENIPNVKVETWDNSLKTTGYKGSNPGAEFVVGGKNGPESYYVKFEKEEVHDQIWTELLAERIYGILGISVPETRVVKVEGSYGHASRIIPNAIDGTKSNEWKKGYLADCLLANWDILNNLEKNTVTNQQTGEVFRVDNGGALLYRAQGARKEDKDFGETVNELNETSIVSPQKMGVSSQELYHQAQIMKEKLTDERIDLMVESVRLKKQDRENLKVILKKRRDYIFNKFLS